MQLISPAAVRDYLGHDNIQRITDIIEGALDNAEGELASLLRTEFVETAHTDIFHVVGSAKLANSNFRTTFLLAQGFVQVAPAYTVKAATTREGLAAASAVDLRSIDSVDKTSVSLERGLIAVDGYDLTSFFVEIGYTAGFAADADTAELYLQTSVPEWLKTASRLAVAIEIATNRKVARLGLKEGEHPPSTAPLKRNLSSLIDTHARYEPLARKALV